MNDTAKVIMSIIYVIFIIYFIYLTNPMTMAFINAIEGVTRILAIAGYFTLSIVALVIYPVSLWMEEEVNE